MTAKGVKYFIDHVNKTTSWEDPRLVAAGIAGRLKPQRKKNKLPKYVDDLYAKVRSSTSLSVL